MQTTCVRNRLRVLVVCLAVAGVWAIAAATHSQAKAAGRSPVVHKFLLAGAAAASPLPAQVTLGRTSQPLPASFVGVSIEYSQMGIYANGGAPLDNVLDQIKPQDGTRLVLRIGGKSADHALWASSLLLEPVSAFEIGLPWLDELNEFVRRDGLRVMLDLNLAVHSSALEASFAQAVRAKLPRGRLAGLEIGNEPDLYWRQTDLDRERVPSTPSSTPRNWSTNYSATDYRNDYQAYARVLLRKVPGIQLGGPEIISSKPQWLDAMEGLGRDTPQFLTIHRYASSTCWPKTSPFYPTISKLLNESSSTGLAQSVHEAAIFAHDHDQALRLTEVNSISCGGNRGVADSFATALWAPDALFEMVAAGTDSVDWHIRPNAINAPFHFTRKGVQAMPELYGLALFADMTRPGATVVTSKVTEALGLHLKAWVVQSKAGLRVLLINKGARGASVNLQLGNRGPAYVRLLRAPRIWSSSGVRFGGQWIGADGRWHGKLHAPRVNPSGGRYQVVVPEFSAALVSIP